jgi:hypothetical protein
MRLEPELWEALAEIGRREQQSLNSLVQQIEAAGHPGGRTSAVRVFLVEYFRDAAAEVGYEPASDAPSHPVEIVHPPEQVPSPGRWIRPSRTTHSETERSNTRPGRLAGRASSDTIRWRPSAAPDRS